MCRNKDRNAENSVGGEPGIGGAAGAVDVEPFPEALPFVEVSSLDLVSSADCRRPNFKPGCRAGAGAGMVTGVEVEACGIGGFELSYESQTSSRNGWQKYKACRTELA